MTVRLRFSVVDYLLTKDKSRLLGGYTSAHLEIVGPVGSGAVFLFWRCMKKRTFICRSCLGGDGA